MINATPVTDPAIVVLKRLQQLSRASGAAYEMLCEAEHKASLVIGQRPHLLIHWRNYHIGRSEFPAMRERLLAAGVEPAIVETEHRSAIKAIEEQRRALRKWDKEGGVTEKRAAFKSVQRQFFAARAELASTPPTTVAGIGAVLAFIARDLTIGMAGYEIAALRTVAGACKAGTVIDLVRAGASS